MPSKRRPWLVTCLSLGVLTFGAVHVLALVDSPQLDLLPLSVTPAYLYGKTMLWAITGLVVGAGLWFGRPWAPSRARIISLVYLVWYWLDRFTMTATTQAHQGWIIPMTIMLVVVAIIWFSLSRTKIQQFFRSSFDE